MEKTVPNSQLHKVEVLNDETGDYEVQQNQKTSVKLAFSPYHPKSNRMFKMVKKKCDIDTVFRKTQTLGNMLKHSSRAPADKFNQQHTVYKVQS